MRGFCDEIDVLFIFLNPVLEGFIFGIGHTRETFGIIELEVLHAGVCKVLVITENESYI